ncbi:MAG TPA: D-alanyl-D-alanine carboxypeptidase/D-alanyl-D-alanine-endopeptidase [Dokdonella sp.]|uniref:D-alanyl-D-alanine carboxypeptidase/D-alanyl-D-alanine endopeptidase n=1 Tax=Dokdonella sp. TaxID=2291710 RepID=UPI002BCC44B8|nr:D-alanyl-D-alanine carboxypeptidase/D-alanyl-D-alanine-endopeptidase [Dokdonella sp.]HUD40427.1 D-alanyl-D-alanine carboxypeptidase/D-alanyl-D-alanine-endopeptidase [Dokdonella sp.]
MRLRGPLAVLLLALAPAAAAADLAATRARIDAILAEPRFAAAGWGIEVRSLDSGRTVYEHQPDRLLVPASTAKLYTAALALATFGADYRIPTVLFATAPPARDGELHGDLVLVGYGDPALGADAAASWADTLAIALRKAGVTRVHGDLIADATRFAAPRYGSGWEAGDLQSWFGAPASALSVDENLVTVQVRPGAGVGDRALLRFEPPGSAPELVNRLVTVARGDGSDVGLFRAPGERTLHAFGTIAAGSAERSYRLALADPAAVAAAQLRAALTRQGVSVDGRVRSVYWPEVRAEHGADDAGRLRTIAQLRSPPLGDLVRRGLKVSQNLYMQNLFLLVGAAEADAARAANPDVADHTGTEQRAATAMRRYLSGIGIAPQQALVEDGAGLSRRNLTTASALTALLVHWGDGESGAPFRLALPQAGIDGSLAGRLRDTPAQGRVHAKTGAMSGVYALAGYLTSAAGERLAFTLLLNQYRPPEDGGAGRPSGELDRVVLALTALDERSAPAAAHEARPPAR